MTDLHPAATDEEVAKVNQYWAAVGISTHTGKPAPAPTGIDQDMVQRVAIHMAWKTAMSCKHPEFVIEFESPLMCNECCRPVQIMSDIQMAEFVEKRPTQ